jgi:beta-lactamase superfamily II metal-dependent hydrolase
VLHPFAPRVAEKVNFLNGKVADLCVFGAERLSAIPGSHFETTGPGDPQLLIYDLEYGAGAAVFSGGNDGAVLLDCGDRQSFKRRIVRSLRGLGISPDAIVLSHPDGGHIGGGSDVWTAFPIKKVLLPVDRSRSPNYRVWSEEAPKAGLEIVRATDVDVLPFPDGARLEILEAPDPQAHSSVADERVAIFRLHWRGWKILFTSDSGSVTESRLLNSGKDLSADVIVAGKHRKDASLGDDFLNAVVPQAIVASHAEFPKEERLDPKLANYWRSRGIQVISQKEAGGVTIRISEEGDLLIEGFVDHSQIRLKRR